MKFRHGGQKIGYIDFDKVLLGFNEYRDGRDNSVIKVFRKTDYSKRKDLLGNIVNNSITEFTVTVMKWREFPKYKMLLSMSNSKIKE